MIINHYYRAKAAEVLETHGIDLLNFYVSSPEGDLYPREYLLISLMKASKRYTLAEAGQLLADAEQKERAFCTTQVAATIQRITRRAVFRVNRKFGKQSDPKQCLIDLGLSVRTFNCLVRAGIVSRDALAQKSDEELLQVINFNQRCVEEVREALQTH